MDGTDIIIISDGSTGIEQLTITLLADGHKVVTIPSVQQLKSWTKDKPCDEHTFILVIGEILMEKLFAIGREIADLTKIGGIVCIGGKRPDKTPMPIPETLQNCVAFARNTTEAINHVKDRLANTNKAGE